MAEFNYNEYIKNNPLLQEEVKEQLLTESQEVSEEVPSKKTTKSELKAEIKELILASLQEEEIEGNQDGDDEELSPEELANKHAGSPFFMREDEEEVEVDIEDEIEVDTDPVVNSGLSKDEMEIQNSLKIAYDNALAIGDQKLADQIGNSITFFTRTHIVER